MTESNKGTGDVSMIANRRQLYDDLLAVMRAIIDGSVSICYKGKSWDEVYAGNVTFKTSNGWTIVMFNDCDDIDYTDSATTPDGITMDFDELYNNQMCPVSFDGRLTPDERKKLEQRFKTAAACG